MFLFLEPDAGQCVMSLRLLKSVLLTMLKKYYLDNSLVDIMVAALSGVVQYFMRTNC